MSDRVAQLMEDDDILNLLQGVNVTEIIPKEVKNV